MHGHWVYLEEFPEKFLESDISSNLETEDVTKTGAARLYKAWSLNQKQRGRNCKI